MQNFIDISDIDSNDLRIIIEKAKFLKEQLKNKLHFYLMKDLQLGMIFEKPSTRTATSFEAGINQLGGRAIILNTQNSQIGRGEPTSDTAKVLSRYVDIIMARCFKHSTVEELAKHASVPVINGLTDFSHPCQVMADIMTFEEHRGNIENKNIAWIGDGNNMTTSWIHAASKFNFTLNIATPKELKPHDDILDWAKNNNAKINLFTNPIEAATNADLITTDTWASMGDNDIEKKHNLLKEYQVNKQLMNLGKKETIFMHCLPAYRGYEVTEDVIDGPQSVIFDEAENRLHAQKSIMLWCLDLI